MDEITVLPPRPTVIPTPEELGSDRTLAKILARVGQRKFNVAADADKRHSNREWLAVMLWDMAVNGSCHCADGTELRVDSVKEWADIVKFLANHLDGPVRVNNQFNGVNVFKVYAGIDIDKI